MIHLSFMERIGVFLFIFIFNFKTYQTATVDAELFVRIFRIDGATSAVQHFTERIDQPVGSVTCPATQFALVGTCVQTMHGTKSNRTSDL